MVDAIRKGAVAKVLGMIEDMAKNEAEKFEKFWKDFGPVIKEGVIEDHANKERLSKLLHFASTKGDGDKQNVTLEAYKERMKEGQSKIYYIAGESLAAVRSSPHLEVFKKRDIEVLLLTDRVDEWLVSNMYAFEDKPLQSIAKGDLDLGELGESETEKEERKSQEEAHKELLERVGKVLGDQVKEVRMSTRLTDSPACLVGEQHDMSASMERILKEAGQAIPESKRILELNPDHQLVGQLKAAGEDEARFGDLSNILRDLAMLGEGGQVNNPADFMSRLNNLLK